MIDGSRKTPLAENEDLRPEFEGSAGLSGRRTVVDDGPVVPAGGPVDATSASRVSVGYVRSPAGTEDLSSVHRRQLAASLAHSRRMGSTVARIYADAAAD